MKREDYFKQGDEPIVTMQWNGSEFVPILPQPWPSRMLMAHSLVEYGDSRYIAMNGDLVNLSVTNGGAEYQIADRFENEYGLVLLHSHWHNPGKI